MGIRELVDGLGGFAARPQLLSAGATDRMLAGAVRAGLVRRVRNGWYSTAELTDPRFIAVRTGGRLTGLSAFQAWGAWIWRRPGVVHVAVSDNAARLRRQPGVKVHWEPQSSGGSATIVSLHDAIVRVLVDEPAELSVPCVDWALATGRVNRIDVERCLLELPRSVSSIGRLIDEESQSVLESVARVRLIRSGFRVASQQPTGDSGASDLVIEDAVALELDGREFHADHFERDRRRDLVTTVEGRHVLRVTSRVLRNEWPLVEAAIRTALAGRRVKNSGHSLAVGSGSQRAHRRGVQLS